eukprot:scaffold10007_cov129-Isochrysis_galbana.AAC.2
MCRLGVCPQYLWTIDVYGLSTFFPPQPPSSIDSCPLCFDSKSIAGRWRSCARRQPPPKATCDELRNQLRAALLSKEESYERGVERGWARALATTSGSPSTHRCDRKSTCG